MFTKEDTLILIGKSPILDQPEVNLKMRSLILRYDNIGINHAAYLYKTKWMAFVDYELKLYYSMIHPNTKILSIQTNFTEHFDGEFYDLYIPHENEKFPIKDGKLAYCGFTHDMCLSWAVLKGYKNVILFGVADFLNNNYIKGCDNLPDRPKNFTPSNKMRDKSVNYINNEFTKYINIFTANPNSILNVERIDVNKILDN